MLGHHVNLAGECVNKAPGHACVVVVAMGCLWRGCDNALQLC